MVNAIEKEALVSYPAIWLSAYTIVASMSFILNTATIIAFITNRSLHRRSVYTLINLAIADIMQGILRFLQSICSFGYDTVGVSCSVQTRMTQTTLMWVASIASILALVLIALERVYAVVYPFKHQVLTTRKYAVIFAASWLLSFLVGLLTTFLTGPPRDVFTLAGFSLGLALSLVILISYIIVFVEVRKQNNQLQQQQQQQESIIRQKREIKLV